MNVPFTIEQFLNVFARYNLTVFPMQIILYFVALIAIYFAIRKRSFSDRLISAILSFFWLWMGIIYHLIYFSPINKAAYIFGILFVVQGVIFSSVGMFKPKLSFQYRTNGFTIVGAIMMLYALIIYPLLGNLFGHVYPEAPTFGVPCPTTIFTFGILLWTDKIIPKYVLLIPFLWSIVGLSAAINFSVYQDFGLIVAGVVGVILIFVRDKRIKQLQNLRS